MKPFGWLNDLVRLVNGVSLVAKEAVARQTHDRSSHTVIKNTILSATNLTGLTKGRIRRVPPPPSTSGNGEFQRPLFSTAEAQWNPTTNASSSLDSISSDFRVPEVNSSGHFSQGNDDATIAQSAPRGETTVEKSDVFPEDSSNGATGLKNLGAADGHVDPVVKRPRKLRERKVPSTPFSRALGFAGLGAGLAWGTLQESAKRLVYGTDNSQGNQSVISPFLSERNAERVALALCRMRGAALKIGQMLSIQDESLIPAPILAAFDIVRQGADVMPRSQLNQVLNAELGPDWASKLINFDYEPMAAASIGQVHKAVTTDGLEVAMKIQYPGVAESIESDIENVKLLLNYTNILPEKMFLDNVMKVAKKELSRECDYVLEAESQKRFRDLLIGTEGFYVPTVVDVLSSKKVLTTELVAGVPIDKVALLDQETRNYVARKLLQLTLTELFVFRFMQTDPNWSNFLYDESTKTIKLIDFGAAQGYPKHFVDDYLKMVIACAENDREAVIEMSQRLGFLTGMESEIMLDAHVQAGFIVGLPFAKPGGYDFRTTNITLSISNLGATMLRHRLTPPPEEAYSLHRKLSGAFLACIKLGAVVPCRELLYEVYNSYQFENGDGESSSADNNPV